MRRPLNRAWAESRLRAGWSRGRIARETGWSDGAVALKFAEWGLFDPGVPADVVARLCAAYRGGATVVQLAADHTMPRAKVAQALAFAGVPWQPVGRRRERQPGPRQRAQAQAEAVLTPEYLRDRLIEQWWMVARVAQETGLGRQVVAMRAARLGLLPERLMPMDPADRKKAVQLYRRGMNVNEVARAVGHGRDSVCVILAAAGITRGYDGRVGKR